MKKALLVGTLLLFSFACSKNPEKKELESKKVFTLNIGEDPNSFDPRKVRDLSRIAVMKMLYDGLTRFTPDQKIELAVAESYEISKDLKTYTFHLRPCKWNNGKEITAYDFETSWKEALDPSFPCDNAFQMYVIKNAKDAKTGKASKESIGIKALDKRTLQIELENPTPYLLEVLTHPVFFPVATQQNEKPQLTGKHQIVSNGPFCIQNWKPQDHLNLEKNVSYWDQKNVKLDQIHLIMVEHDSEMMMFEKKEVDWMGSPLSTIVPDAIKEMKKNKNLQIEPFLATFFLRTNVEKPPFTNVAFRKALSLAINRKEIVEHILQGGQVPATGLVPKSMGLSGLDYFQDGDIETAKMLLNQACEEMGVTVKTLPEIVLTTTGSDKNRLITQALQQQWATSLGIHVRLETVENKFFFSRISQKDYQLAISDWVADYNDPINFLEIFKYKKTGTNNTNWENEEYTRLLEESNKTSDHELRFKLLAQSEKILMDESPIIPIYYYSMVYVKNDRLKDVVLSSLGSLDFKWADLAPVEIVMEENQKPATLQEK